MKNIFALDGIERETKEVALTNTFLKVILPEITKYQRQLFLLLINEAQPYIKGQKLDDSFSVSEWSSKTFTFKINQLLDDEDDEHYTLVRKAIQALMKKTLPFTFGENRKLEGEVNFINGYIYDRSSSSITVSLDEIVWEVLFDFARGYNFVDLYVCMMCSSHFVINFYSLIYDDEKITLTIEQLKTRLGLQGKYVGRNSDFINKIVVPAQKELDRISPKSFTFEVIKDKKKRGEPITGLVLTSVRHIQNMPTKQLRKLAAPAFTFSKELRDVLQEKMEFNSKQIMSNIELFSKAEKIMGTESFRFFIDYVTPYATRVDNPRGYFVNALKKHLEVLIV